MAGYRDIAAESPWVPDDGKPYTYHACRIYRERFGHEPPHHLVQHWEECQKQGDKPKKFGDQVNPHARGRLDGSIVTAWRYAHAEISDLWPAQIAYGDTKAKPQPHATKQETVQRGDAWC